MKTNKNIEYVVASQKDWNEVLYNIVHAIQREDVDCSGGDRVTRM